jgi:hypothetical protein
MFGLKGYWLSRSLFQSGLALVYLIAFLCALNQFRPLLGEHGLTPVPDFVRQVPFRDSPSLFYFWPKDAAFLTAAWIGILLSIFAMTGFAQRGSIWIAVITWALLWALYLSLVNVGQTFYGFGWESILLEAGFLAIFLGTRRYEAPVLVMWLLRWLEFRLMFGAGLIKMRGDACWRDYTCLDYHYETQPMPNPASWFLHNAPEWSHRFEVGFNHFSELIVPFAYFLPQPIASIAGIITILFQASIMFSGNLSWLNFLTIILAIPLLDDRLLAFAMPFKSHVPAPIGIGGKVVVVALFVLIAYLSISPIRNMLSPSQVMNTSYDPLHIVGTYGAFGSITKTRYEIIVEGTDDAVMLPSTKWKEYEFKGKPGDITRMPPQIAPYHLRLDWLMWFAAMSDYSQHPWFVHFLVKLLQGDRDTLSLLHSNPFPDHPPHFIRAELYEYHFTTPDERRKTGNWWKRQFTGMYFPAVSLDTPEFRRMIEGAGWL